MLLISTGMLSHGQSSTARLMQDNNLGLWVQLSSLPGLGLGMLCLHIYSKCKRSRC